MALFSVCRKKQASSFQFAETELFLFNFIKFFFTQNSAALPWPLSLPRYFGPQMRKPAYPTLAAAQICPLGDGTPPAGFNLEPVLLGISK